MPHNDRIRTEQAVADHYAAVSPNHRVYDGLRAAGVDMANLDVDSLAPVDEFHIRGREATIELAEALTLDATTHVLDVGCGIGGSARYLSEQYGCRVTGIDLTAEYCELANRLSQDVGLGELNTFRQASALELPFADASFDVVWTEHAQMNIADQRGFYSEMVRVLRPGGVIAFHDMFGGDGGQVVYPTPWASDAASSFLYPADDLRGLLSSFGLSVEHWVDCSAVSTTWFRAVSDKIAAHGPPAVGVNLLMGDDAGVKVANGANGFESGAIVAIQAILRKPA